MTHPHAVAVYDTGEDAECDIFIVMERLTGRTLAHELADGPLDEPRLRQVADAVLGALGAAHAEGIVHRDVKPGNILLTDDGDLKIGDFGIATFLDASDTVTRVPLGRRRTPRRNTCAASRATARSDLYSLGVVLYEAAAGMRPFTGDGPSAVAEAVVVGIHVPLGDQRPDLSPALVATVERALATDPADRFDDAEAMRGALDAPPPAPSTVPIAVTLPLGASASETATLPPPARPAPVAAPVLGTASRHDATACAPRPVVVLVALVLVLGAVLVLLATCGDDAPSTNAPTTVHDAVGAGRGAIGPRTARRRARPTRPGDPAVSVAVSIARRAAAPWRSS